MTPADLPPLQAYQWTATGLKAYDRNHFGVAQYVRADDAERAIKLAVQQALERAATICEHMQPEELMTGKVDHNEVPWTWACCNAIRAIIKEYE